MDQPSMTLEKPATRAPVFFWITVALIGMLLLGGAAAVVLLWVFAAENINRSGGWGWLLVGGIFVVAIFVVCFACALSTAVSLFRREPHRRLSIAILIISGLVVSAFGANLIRAVHALRHQHDEAARRPERSARSPADTSPRSSIPPSADRSANAPVTREGENRQILELKSKLEEAIRAKNADAFVDCFFIEARFNTPEIRQENRDQVEILLRGETIDVEVRDIPDRELVEIMKIQHAKPASLVRYSLFPRKLLRIQQEASNGRMGRSFLIGEKNGQWYIITLAGHTT
jgi:hypothetical protein